MESNNNSGMGIEKLAAAGGLFAGGLGILELLNGGNGGLLNGNRGGSGLLDLVLLRGLLDGNGGNNCGNQTCKSLHGPRARSNVRLPRYARLVDRRVRKQQGRSYGGSRAYKDLQV